MNTRLSTRFVISSAVIILFLSACSAPALPLFSVAVAPTNAPVPKIAFTTDRDGNGEIYLMNLDGSGLTNLTNNPASDALPTWSPDGKRIAFNSNREGVKIGDIYVMEADGTGLTRLTKTGNAVAPNWSPDGKRIVFNTFASNGLGSYGYYISVINTDGSGLTQLTDEDKPGGHQPSPRWLLDSKRITYPSSEDDDVYVINDDGTGLTRITGDAKVRAFDWSPDATRIAFISEREYARNLYVMKADGSNQIRLTNYAANIWDPSWSPDSTRIAFSSDRQGNEEIYIINADGSGETRLTNTTANEGSPAWQKGAGTSTITAGTTTTVTGATPVTAQNTTTQTSTNLPLLKGPRLAFSKYDSDYSMEIYIGQADGEQQFLLGKGYQSAVWSPSGQQLAMDCQSGWCITIINVDGTNPRKVAGFRVPVWAPDGCTLFGRSEIQSTKLRVNVAGTGLEVSPINFDPQWMPDGAHIVYYNPYTAPGIYNSDADGKNARGLPDTANMGGFRLSPDGTRIVYGSDVGFYIMDLVTNGRTRLAGDDKIFGKLEWSPDGKQLLGIGEGGSDFFASLLGPLLIFSADGSSRRVLVDKARSPAWSPDGTQIAYETGAISESMIHVVNVDGSGDRTLYAGNDPVWAPLPPIVLPLPTCVAPAIVMDMSTPTPIPTKNELATFRAHTESIYGATFSPDGSKVVTASDDKTAKVWDARTYKEIATLRGHKHYVSGATFSPDGSKIVTASGDNTAKVWDAGTYKELATLQGHTDSVRSAVFSPDGTKIVTASRDGMVRVWDAATGKELATLRGHTDSVWSAVFSPDGTKIVTASDDKTARVWDAGTYKELTTLQGQTDDVSSPTFSPDGSKIVTEGCAVQDIDNHCTAGRARVWDATTYKELATLQGHTDSVWSVTFSPDGSKIVTASGDNTAKMWDAGTYQELATLQGHTDHVSSATFSPDGSKIVTASWDKTAKVWDAVTGKELATLRGHPSWLQTAEFSPDGSKIVTASIDGTIRFWDTDFK